jgi:hypothetical protein
MAKKRRLRKTGALNPKPAAAVVAPVPVEEKVEVVAPSAPVKKAEVKKAAVKKPVSKRRSVAKKLTKKKEK